MGGFSVLHHAAHYPVLTSAVFAIAPVTTGVNLLNAWRENTPEEYEQWQREGYLEKVSAADGERKGHVPWEAWKEWLLHTLYPLAPDLVMPTYFVHARDDVRIPPDHLQRFITHVPEPKSYEVLDSGGHSFEDTDALKSLLGTIKQWLQSNSQ
jgi:pimeloyl-ACP methyl ester carboxylesterase